MQQLDVKHPVFQESSIQQKSIQQASIEDPTNSTKKGE